MRRCSCMVLGMITHFPFNMSPSSTDSSVWNDQYSLSWFGSSLTRLGHPCTMTSLSSHRTWSFAVSLRVLFRRRLVIWMMLSCMSSSMLPLFLLEPRDNPSGTTISLPGQYFTVALHRKVLPVHVGMELLIAKHNCS